MKKFFKGEGIEDGKMAALLERNVKLLSNRDGSKVAQGRSIIFHPIHPLFPTPAE